jgi:xylulose-5-phosphate/fructose-6-phosphate phosphoketolase
LDRFHLVLDVLHRLPQLGKEGEALQKTIGAKLILHKQYIYKYGQDMPEILNWKWQ